MSRTVDSAGHHPPDPTTAADRIHSAAIRILRGVRSEDALAGVTAARLSALSVLVFAGPRTVGQLADAEQVSVPTISRMIAGMVKDGLVRRVADAEDRRVVWLHATERGAKILQRARRRRVDALASRLARLSDGELEELVRVADLIEGLFLG